MHQYKKLILFLIKLSISLCLIIYVFTFKNIDELYYSIVKIDVWYFIIAALLVVVQSLMGSVRWFFIIRLLGYDITLMRCFKILYISSFLAAVIPGGSFGGDAYRVISLHRYGVPIKLSFITVLYERLLIVFSMFLFSAVCLPWITSSLPNISKVYLCIFPLITLLIVFSVSFLVKYENTLLNYFKIENLAEELKRFNRFITSIITTPVLVFNTFGIALLSNLTLGLIPLVLAYGLGVRPSPLIFMAIIIPVLFLSVLPISIGGWGVRENGFLISLSYLHYDPSVALTISIAFGIAVVMGNIPAVLFFFIPERKISYRKVDY